MALADFAAGANNAIQEILKRRLLEQRYQDSLKQQAFQNQIATRGADRADAQLTATMESNRLMREAQQRNTNNTRAQQIVDRAEPDTFYQETDPTAQMIRGTDYASFLKPVQPTQAMGADFQGPMPDAETPQQAQVGRQGGFLKMATSTQRMQESQRQDRIADNTRLDAQVAANSERDNKRDDETVRHNKAMENKPSGPQGFGVVQSGDGYIRFNKKSGNFEAQDETGAWSPVSNPSLATPGTVRTREDTADRVVSHFDNIDALLKQANARGLLGPAKGRISDFLAGKVGSTGNPDDDDLLGELRQSISMARSGTAMLHGRGGANVGIVKAFEKNLDEGNMSYEELHGALRGMREWVDTYAKPADTRGGKPKVAKSAEELIREYGGAGAKR